MMICHTYAALSNICVLQPRLRWSPGLSPLTALCVLQDSVRMSRLRDAIKAQTDFTVLVCTTASHLCTAHLLQMADSEVNLSI